MEQFLLNLKPELTFDTSAFQFKELLKIAFFRASQQRCVGKYILSESFLRVVNTCFFVNKVLSWAVGLCPVWLQEPRQLDHPGGQRVRSRILSGLPASPEPKLHREGQGEMSSGK